MANTPTNVPLQEPVKYEMDSESGEWEDVEDEIGQQPTGKRSKRHNTKKRKNAKQMEKESDFQMNGKRDKAENGLSEERNERIDLKLRALGYSDEQIASLTLISPVQTDWSHLMYQKGELTEHTWNYLLPKLEDSIREYEQTQFPGTSLTTRCICLAQLYRNYVVWRGLHKANYIPLAFVDLCLIAPPVASMLITDDFSPESIVGRWYAFEVRLPALWVRHSRRVELDCLTAFLSQMRDATEAGLSSRVTRQSTKTLSPDDVDPNLLRRAYVWFDHYQDFNGIFTFEEIIEIRRDALYEIDDRSAWNASNVSVDREVVLLSKALLRSLGFPVDTAMRHIKSLRYAFTCSQCEHPMRKPMTWYMLVNHLRDEIRKNRQEQQNSRVSINSAQHEMHKPEGNIATMDPSYTGLSPKMLVEAWASEKASTESECEFCFPVSEPPKFKSKEEKDAHFRYRHDVRI